MNEQIHKVGVMEADGKYYLVIKYYDTPANRELLQMIHPNELISLDLPFCIEVDEATYYEWLEVLK